MLDRDYEITLDSARDNELNAHLDRSVDDENEQIDETLGMKSNEISIPFKLAFNSLINKKLINKY